MPLSFIAMSVAASFACVNPTHHDGDNMRCSNMAGALRLQGIDAPEMPGACRPGRACVDGDPYTARNYLRSLTAGRDVRCVQEDTDSYGRAIVNCTADGVNISCAMIAAGQAVPRYAPLDCSGQEYVAATAQTPAGQPAPANPQLHTAPERMPERMPERIIVPIDIHVASPTPGAQIADFISPSLLVLVGQVLINLITWAMFTIDKRRAQAGRSRERIAERTLLGWAALGGSPAAWFAISRLRHKSSKDSFKQTLLLISGVQVGLVLGGVFWWLTG